MSYCTVNIVINGRCIRIRIFSPVYCSTALLRLNSKLKDLFVYSVMKFSKKLNYCMEYISTAVFILFFEKNLILCLIFINQKEY